MTQTQEQKLDIIENFINYLSSDENEREGLYNVAHTYVEEDHVDELANQKAMTDEQIYWFARGYHDGRAVGAGVDEGLDVIGNREEDAANRVAYKRGYDTGVADYCDLDESVEVRDEIL